jgi:hypothetical protein
MKYQNSLDQFQSHSVHYIVLAARSTEAVRKFTATDPTSMKQSLLAIDGAKKLGEQLKLPGSSSLAYLMIDTRRFSQFTIDNFSMDAHIAGFNVPGSTTPSSTSMGMSFDVLDSVGISFANFLQWMMDQELQVNFDGLTLLVKLLFVGNRADGTSETIQTVTVPAILNKIQVQLTDTKGIYSCELFPLIGTPSNSKFNPKWTHIGNASSFFTGVSTNTLGDVVDSFEKRLNDESLTYYNQINVKSQQPGAENKSQPANSKFGRPVQYMITIPESWRKFKFNGPSSHGAAEVDFVALLKAEQASKTAKAKASKQKSSTNAQQVSQPTPQDSYVSVDSTMSITEVLDFIFKQTADVMRLGNFSKTAAGSSVKFYKNLLSMTSDDNSIVVHIDVFEFEVPNVYLNKNSKAPLTAGDQALFAVNPETGKKEPKNYIELDYIFSGKNIDVLDMDLKIENMVSLLADKSKLGQAATYVAADSGQAQQTDGDGVEKDDVITNMRAKDPVIMPMKTAAERTNYSAFNSATGPSEADDSPQTLSQRYLRNLSAFYNLGPYDAKLELRGNPDLIVFVTLTTIQPHVSSTEAGTNGGTTSNASVKSTYRTAIEADIIGRSNGNIVRTGSSALKVQFTGPKFVTTPVFVKVNVFGPNVDFVSNDLVQGAAFQRRLLFDNYYWLSTITSKISGSKFTHELELKPYTMFGVSAVTASGPQVVKPTGGTR